MKNFFSFTVTLAVIIDWFQKNYPGSILQKLDPNKFYPDYTTDIP
ncbi:hypothetical protein [Elizabethkingia meningoseptica]|nr:hypothetical protein [Elizabethkingia meningoseptica]